MYIVAIGWLFVALMMAITATGFLSALGMLLVYGILPLGLFLWIAGAPQRRRRAAELRDVADEESHQRDGSDSH